MIQAGLYLRMSRDAEARGLGIGRQRKDGETLASRLGWPIVQEYSDNDLSASKYSHKPRQGYAQMLEDLQEGAINGVGGWVYKVCGARCPAGDTMRRSHCLDRLGGSCGHCTPPPPGAGARAGSQAPPSMGSPRTGCPLITRRSLSRTRGS